jgi:zinc transport system substrate-binding protein
MLNFLRYLIMVALLALPVAAEKRVPTFSARFATTTSWLEVCLHDLAGDEIDLLRITPPGTCPGHFDIQPGIFKALQACDLLFYFDFQESIQEKLASRAIGGPKAISVPSPSGMSVPDQYVDTCEDIYEVLAKYFPEEKESLEKNLSAIKKRMEALTGSIKENLAGTVPQNIKVLSSGHQRFFAEWLGFEVAGIFSGTDTASPKGMRTLINAAKEQGVSLVIGNLQEGTQYASLLAEELKVPLVIFSNFPSMEEKQKTFDSLVLYNIQQLTDNYSCP